MFMLLLFFYRYASDIPLLLRVMCDPAGPKLQLGLQVR